MECLAGRVGFGYGMIARHFGSRFLLNFYGWRWRLSKQVKAKCEPGKIGVSSFLSCLVLFLSFWGVWLRRPSLPLGYGAVVGVNLPLRYLTLLTCTVQLVMIMMTREKKKKSIVISHT